MNQQGSSEMLHSVFNKSASLHPEAKALISSKKTLTYEALFDYSMTIGVTLRSAGILPNQLVAVMMDKGWEQIAAVLGILQSGGAYLPIDPNYPQTRRNVLLENGKVGMVLTQSWLCNSLKLPAGVKSMSIDTLPDVGKKRLEHAQQANDLAYVIYTSGSTGNPKGVMIQHKGALNTILDINKRFSIDRNHRVLALSNLNFDLSVYDIFGTLAAGGTIVLPDHDKIAEPSHWTDLILEHQVTLWNSVPALMQVLVDYSRLQSATYNDLRLVLLSGDWIPLHLPDQIRVHAKNSRIISLGGATEASIWSILYPVQKIKAHWKSIPYGKPMTKQYIHVLDDNLKQCKVNVPGQLHIGGVGVASGYWEDTERTKESFIVHPETGDRLYRTGDLGAYMPDGNIEFLGRKDFQVKIRGYRIELGEIENTIKKHPDVSSAIVQVFENNNSKKIAAYVVPSTRSTYAVENHQRSCEHHISEWTEIYEHIYEKKPEKQKAEFNTAGWVSSYTGMSIPQPEMFEWLENTVGSIRSLRPETVLEIGCGTGMLISRIAPECRSYTGTDVSAQALRHVKAIIAGSNELNNVHLFKKTADDFSALPEEAFDTIVINSVVQHFPTLQYLEKVMDNAVHVLRPGGHIFIGDLRSYDLLNLFHSSVQLYRAPDDLSVPELKNRITYNATREIELTVSPRFFVKLKNDKPEIKNLSISPKIGRYANELNCFRYDVVLQIQGASSKIKSTQIDWLDAEDSVTCLEDIKRVLKKNDSKVIGIRSIKNKRMYGDVQALDLLEQDDTLRTVKQLKQAVSIRARSGIDPHALYETAKAYAYESLFSWANTDNHGSFDTILVPSAQKEKIRPSRFFTENDGESELNDANDPMHGRFIRELIPSLKQYLRQTLPEYMQPAFFMLLEDLPLNANGKIDRKNLPEPHVVAFENEKHVPPRDEKEKGISKIWCRILNVEEAGIDDDFFVHGGDSLLAMQFLSTVNAEFQIGLSLRDLLSAPTIRQVALKTASDLNKKNFSELPQIDSTSTERDRPFPLTGIQHAYWMGRNSSFELGNISTHIYFEVEGTDLDIGRLNQTWQQLIVRHDMLKTIIAKDGSQRIIQQPPFFEFSVTDMRKCHGPAEKKRLNAIRTEMVGFFPASDQWPLFDIRISRLKNKIVRIHMVFEVMVIDAWSLFLLMKEWRRLYENPDVLLPEIELTFRDYVLADAQLKKSPPYLKARAYWLEKLETLPPSPELPLAVDPSAIETPVFKRSQHSLSKDLWEKLKHRGSRKKITSSVILLAAYAEILNKWSRHSEFTINITLFNRPPLHPEINDIVGDFTSLTLLSVDNSRKDTFGRRAMRIQKQLWDDMDNRLFNGIEVIRELARKKGTPRKALMPVVFTSLSPDSFGKDFRGLNEMGRVVYTITQTSQVWIDHQVMENADGSLFLSWDSVDGLFPDGLIEDMFSSYCHLLEQLATDDDIWHQPVIESMPLDQKKRRADLNATDHPLSDQMLHSLVIKRAIQNTDKTAIVSSGRKLSYGCLLDYSNHMGRKLIENGASKNDLIAIVMEKGWEQIAGVLSILTAGAAYLPIDPQTPPQRLSHILKSGKVRIILTQSWLENQFKWPKGSRVWSMDTVVPESGKEITVPLQTPRDLAYVMYTSGSTGLPKGVMIDHRGAVNTILDINDRLGIDSTDSVLTVSALSFDLSVYDIFGILAAGGTIVIPDRDKIKEPFHWLELMEKENITIWNSVPALMKMLIEFNRDNYGKVLKHMKHVLLSGDWIPVTLPDQVKQIAGKAEVISLGGATEASIWSILYPIEESGKERKSIPYGKPMKNQRFYILNRNMGNCPDWVTGQLYIGGVGLAKGYWDDDEKTDLSFVKHPETGERLYKTGDIGRFLPDGNIEFQGREDLQVKIRGHRIELGEIEITLKQHPQVKHAFVSATGKMLENKRLVAYVIAKDDTVTSDRFNKDELRTNLKDPDISQTGGAPEKHFSPSGLKAFLGRRLPEYMIPSHYLLLDEVPMSPNGKVDRKKLSVAQEAMEVRENIKVPPRTHQETVMAEIWAQVLQADPIGIHDNFFENGGDSLLATRIVTRVRRTFDVEPPLSVLFECPTVAKLTAHIQAQAQADKGIKAQSILPRIVPDPDNRHQPFPLTPVQAAYWVGRRHIFELGNTPTHMYSELQMDHTDVGGLEHAWQRLIRRHEMLRAVILADGRQRILAHVPEYKFKIHDLRSLNRKAVDHRLDAVRQEMSHQILTTDKWPLFDIRLSLLDGGKARLHTSFDALILDAWSFFIIFDEWNRLYRTPDVVLPDIELSFRDYVLAESSFRDSKLYSRDRSYWLNRLNDLPSAPELPYAVAPATVVKPMFKRLTATLPAEKWKKLKQSGMRKGLTPSCILLAAYASVLSAWSRIQKFTINLTLFNRLPNHPQVNDIIGDFTSLTLLAVDNSEPDTFVGFAGGVQRQLWSDLEHRNYCGIEVLRELIKIQGKPGKAMMPIVFTSALGLTSLGRDASSVLNRLGKFVHGIAQTPQVALDHQVMEQDGNLIFNWDAVEELFHHDMLEQMFDAYCRLLEMLADGEKAWENAMEGMIPDEQMRRRVKFNATEKEAPAETLCALFREQVIKQPEKEAVITSDRTLSYRELAAISDNLAGRLTIEKVRPNTLVAIVMEKGWEQVAGVLGILKSGAAYLPIDPGLPGERIDVLLSDGRVQWVVTQSKFEKKLKWPVDVKCLALDRIKPVSGEACSPETIPGPEDLAYVIYTSGSTGRPKGVMVDHRGAVNTLADINRRFRVKAGDRVLALSALNFDLSVYDIFGTLAAGGTIVIPDPEGINDPGHWSELMKAERITVWNSVPQLMQMLVEHESGNKAAIAQSLRLVLLSGDWISTDLPSKIKSLFRKAEVVSLGGATEASIWSIFYRVKEIDPRWKSIPYGRPLANQKFFILNDKMEDCPEWVAGQMYIGGIGLAKGYWNDVKKTESSFLSHPKTGERIYKTGDIGRFLPDGHIEFMGREDNQVKINGYRIELGEIESVLKGCAGVHEAVARVATSPQNNKRLVGYVVPEKDKRLSGTELKKSLKKILPEYMVPSYFVILGSLPTTPNGKVDRKNLPEPGLIATDEKRDFIAPRNDSERVIAKILKEIVGAGKVGIKDNFFDIGADSMHLVRIQNKLKETFGQHIAMVDLFTHPSIYSLARYLSQKDDDEIDMNQASRRAEIRKSKRKKRSRRTIRDCAS